MIKEIVTDPELLNKVAEPATAEDAGIAQDLIDTMEADDTIACLAANQIGENKAIIAISENDNIHVMYNPKIKMVAFPFKTAETCLSMEGESIAVRYKRCTVDFQLLKDGELVDRTRKFKEWNAQIVQHAIDHTNGILI